MSIKHPTTTPLHSRRPSQQFLFLCYLSLYAIILVVGFTRYLDFPDVSSNIRNGLAALFLFDIFGLEFFLLLLFTLLFYRENKILRWIVHIIAAAYILIGGIQLAAYDQTGEFITSLAIENINHISFLITPATISGILALLCIGFFPALIFMKYKGSRTIENPAGRATLALIFVISLTILACSSRLLPQSVYTLREKYLVKNMFVHTSPVYELYRAIAAEPALGEVTFSNYEIQELKKSGFHLNQNSPYPLIKDTFYKGEMVFPTSIGKSNKPNIIVFFSEGISERSLSISDVTLYPDLTPSIEDFAEKSMVVNNYYSHTAATYRGLLGQLCSLFPKYGGAVDEARYLSLPDIFNDLEYETIFFDAHDKEKAHVDELMARIGFQTVFTAESLLQNYLPGQKSKGFEALSDNQFMDSLVAHLKENEDKSNPSPFFISLYNLGTHAFRDITDDGKKYDKKDNATLHTIHNFDHAFGTFWSYFQKSPYAENTIVILTSDHSHIAEKPFVKAFNQPGYQGLFVDKIPLIIHDQTRDLPPSYDAIHSTSIDFAPSLLHYLGIPQRPNPFMGTSIFEKRQGRNIRYGIAQHGKEAFLVDHERVHRLRYTQQYKEKLSLIDRYIKHTQELETTGKLWDPNHMKTELPNDE